MTRFPPRQGFLILALEPHSGLTLSNYDPTHFLRQQT